MKKIFAVLLITVLISICFSIVCEADSAVSSVLINGETGEVLYYKNARKKLPMASTTKIMTALLLCENIKDLDTTFTATKEAVEVEGTSMGLKAGDKVSANALLFGMMLSSGNDAANMAAIAVSGSIEKFVSLMNKKAKQLNLCDTHFATPSGLDGEDHHTTALDLASLTRTALKNKRFKKAAGTKSITLSYGGSAHTLTNHHRLVREFSDIIGVKTGYTKKAGRCLVTAAENNGMYLIAVTLNDRNDWKDHREIINGGYELLKNNQKTQNEKTVFVPLSCGGSVKATVPMLEYYSDNNDLKVKVALPKFVYPEIKAGEEIGTAYFYKNYKCIKELKITAKEDKKLPQKENKQRFFIIFKTILFSLGE